MALQTEDNKVNIENTPPSDRVPTPAQNNENPTTQEIYQESQIGLHFLAVLHDYHNTNASNQLYCDIESIINIVMSPISFFDLQEQAQISGKPANRRSHARGDCRTAIHQ